MASNSRHVNWSVFPPLDRVLRIIPYPVHRHIVFVRILQPIRPFREYVFKMNLCADCGLPGRRAVRSAPFSDRKTASACREYWNVRFYLRSVVICLGMSVNPTMNVL